MSRTFTFIQTAGPEDYQSFQRIFQRGEQVQEFTGHTCGLVRDDLMYGGVKTVACTSADSEGFFTVPCDFIIDQETGKHPECEYVLIPHKA